MVGVTGSIPVAPTIFGLHLTSSHPGSPAGLFGMPKVAAMNAINIIAPYKHLGM
jgi:hypothetical protein